MRIRKRFPVGSVGLTSDPQLLNPSPAPVVQPRPDLATGDQSEPSDLGSRWVLVKDDKKDEDIGKEKWEKKKMMMMRKAGGSILGAEVVGRRIMPVPPSAAPAPAPHHQVVLPLKKRRGSFEEEEEEEMKKKKKKRKSSGGGGGGVIMEGSRCSRVNGRGWRCCQQTLVGYSLCEHHLGKGSRLRSINSNNTSQNTSLISIPQDYEEGDHEKKRVKLGVVKARSIRSLLGQPNTTTTTTSVALAPILEVAHHKTNSSSSSSSST